MKTGPYGLLLVVALAAWPASGGAEPPSGASAPVRRAPVSTARPAPVTSARRAPGRGPATPARDERSTRTQIYDQTRRIDVNTINMFVTNYGTYANDIENQGNAGFFFPKGTIKTAVYQAGIWLVGKVGGQTRAAIGEYSQEYAPGAMVGSSPDDSKKPEYIVYKVARYTGNPQDTAHVERDAAAVAADRTLDPLVHHSWSEYMAGAAPHGAPTRTYRFPGATVPTDSVDVVGPDVQGDQMLWSVYNDADPSVHINRAGMTAPLGVEVQQTTFGFARQGALGGTVFLQFKVINKGTSDIDSCYINLWADPDLGGAGDDLVGCDTTLSLGYVYNSTNNDQIYGSNPPALGCDFFQGPKVAGVPMPMTAFIYYINGTDPNSVQQTYFYMQGLQRTGVPFLDPNGNPTKFYASGDPVTGTGYLDSNPSDRRFMDISGPFTLAKGDTQVIVGAFVIAQGSDRLSSITGMKFFDIKAQKAFDLNFQLPPPPPQPKVVATPGHQSVTLLWDANSRFNYTPEPGWAFEGYNVYQGSSVSGPWKRLKTFDIINGIKDVRDTVFDVNTGLIINDTPVAFGGDNGVQYTYTTDQDAVRGGPLRDGTPYYYAVTAYAVNLNPPAGLEKVLETAFQPVTVTPQRPPSGTDIGAAKANAAVDQRANPAIVATTDHMVADVVDPASITGHTYAISFQVSGPDTLWTLTDRNTGQNLLSNIRDRGDTATYAPVDGMLVKVRQSQSSAPATDPLNDVYYAPFDNDMPFVGVGGVGITNAATPSAYFDDSFGYAAFFFAGIDPTVSPEAFHNVELRFGPTQKAYQFFRDELADGSAPPGGRGYKYGGFRDIGFQAWDVDSSKQLQVGFVERRVVGNDTLHIATGAQPPTHDNTWMPDNSSLGGREYLFISARPYTVNPDTSLAKDGAVIGADTLWTYAAWLRRTGTIQAGDKFVIVAGGDRHASPNDTLVFSTQAAAHNVASLQKAAINNIRVVPNPYYSRSSYEISSFNKIIKFVNMPENATVRIYNLSGHLVRTLHKTDPGTSILQWDVQNENRLPVASGIYVYQVEVPGVGRTVGRMVVFMEKERLQNF